MPLASLPPKMHAYLARESTQRHFSVADDVVFFAPGAVYPLLPLWVEGQGECEEVFKGVEGYANEILEGGVVGKVGWREEKGREVEFWVEGWKVEGRGREEL